MFSTTIATYVGAEIHTQGTGYLSEGEGGNTHTLTHTETHGHTEGIGHVSEGEGGNTHILTHIEGAGHVSTCQYMRVHASTCQYMNSRILRFSGVHVST